MLKRFVSIFCIVLLLSTTGVFAETKSSVCPQRIGGGTSEFWFYKHAYNSTISRSELVNISYKLEKIERKESNMQKWKVVDIVSAFGKQLGENYKVVSKEINNPISAHLLSIFHPMCSSFS